MSKAWYDFYIHPEWRRHIHRMGARSRLNMLAHLPRYRRNWLMIMRNNTR